MNELATYLPAVGGLGLFLFGMVSMTDGLKALAGSRLHRFLARYTKSPSSGAASGAFCTALIQSSSATTVAAVSFVGAGLLTFPQALGVIFGANLGTTITGWMVALVGFKLKLGTMALPLIFVGALMQLFGRSKVRAVGRALAGFGVLFVGIDMLQDGLAQLRGVVMPESFPGNTVFGRAKLMFIGLLITLVTQSSSAGVAAAMTAVAAGTINLPQAAAMVIGMDVGTTITACMATIGGTTQVKRTGYAHVVYNLMTAVMAFVILVPWFGLVESWIPGALLTSPEMVLVGFHTTFNALGVVLVLPVAGRFANFLEWLVPERESATTRGFDERLLRDPVAALAGALGSLRATTAGVEARLRHGVAGERLADDEELRQACRRARRFLTRLTAMEEPEELFQDESAAMHVTDHLDRLLDRIAEADHWRTLLAEPMLEEQLAATRALISRTVVEGAGWHRRHTAIQNGEKAFRKAAISGVTAEELTVEQAEDLMDTYRWLRRMTYHQWRIHCWLERAGQQFRGCLIDRTND
jgi:phosphate:Na+ symporter